MSSSSKRKAPTISGVDTSQFENFITAGSSLAGDATQSLAISRTARRKKTLTSVKRDKDGNFITPEGSRVVGGLGGPRRTTTQKEQFEAANLINISQADLDNLASNFTQRRSSIIAKRQQPGREQLILSRESA